MISASTPLTGSYDYSEVARSVFIAIVASYAALDIAGRVTAARGRIRLAWLSGGAIAMGLGIWAMHFKGMLAFRLPVPVEYHWPTVLASLLVAILSSASPPDLSHAVSISPLGNNGILIATLTVLAAAIATSSVDRRRSEDRLRLVVDTTPAMLYSARPDGYLDFFNKRWQEYVGVSLDDLLGWQWPKAIHPDDVAKLVDKWR